jgi:hypothetical protein
MFTDETDSVELPDDEEEKTEDYENQDVGLTVGAETKLEKIGQILAPYFTQTTNRVKVARTDLKKILDLLTS